MGLVLSSTDADMMAGWDVEKNDPADVVRVALDGIEARRLEVLADKDSAETKAALSADPSVVYTQVRVRAPRERGQRSARALDRPGGDEAEPHTRLRHRGEPGPVDVGGRERYTW